VSDEEGSMSEQVKAGGKPPKGEKTNPAALVLAAVSIVAFFVAVYVMWGKADDADNETAWARWTFLLAGIEAIAFAAAGWIFGREVHRVAAVQARKDAKEAGEEAKEQRDRATTAITAGRSLRNAILAEAGSAGAGRPADALGGRGMESAPDPMQRLAAQAQAAFPD
jgi:hypothetical protein